MNDDITGIVFNRFKRSITDIQLADQISKAITKATNKAYEALSEEKHRADRLENEVLKNREINSQKMNSQKFKIGDKIKYDLSHSNIKENARKAYIIELPSENQIKIFDRKNGRTIILDSRTSWVRKTKKQKEIDKDNEIKESRKPGSYYVHVFTRDTSSFNTNAYYCSNPIKNDNREDMQKIENYITTIEVELP